MTDIEDDEEVSDHYLLGENDTALLTFAGGLLQRAMAAVGALDGPADAAR